MTEFKIIEHMSYDWMIVVYFFLGGLGAGSYLFSVAANYWKKEFKPLARTAAIIAPVSIALGLLFLLLDLGQPFRAWALFINFNPTSVLSWGVWFLNIFLGLSAAYAFYLIIGEDKKAKKFAYAGVPFAILTAAYTAILLAQSSGRAFWHSSLLPVLFLVGGLISGIAAVLLVSSGRDETKILAKLGKFLAWIILLELGLTLVEFIVLFNGGHDGVRIAKHVIGEGYGFLFWVVQIALGAVVPVIIFFRNKLSSSVLAMASMLVLIGIFTMRYVVVVGGQIPTYY